MKGQRVPIHVAILGSPTLISGTSHQNRTTLSYAIELTQRHCVEGIVLVDADRRNRRPGRERHGRASSSSRSLCATTACRAA